MTNPASPVTHPTDALAHVLASLPPELRATPTPEHVAAAAHGIVWLREHGWDVGREHNPRDDDTRATMMAGALAAARGAAGAEPRDEANVPRAVNMLWAMGFALASGHAEKVATVARNGSR